MRASWGWFSRVFFSLFLMWYVADFHPAVPVLADQASTPENAPPSNNNQAYHLTLIDDQQRPVSDAAIIVGVAKPGSESSLTHLQESKSLTDGSVVVELPQNALLDHAVAQAFIWKSGYGVRSVSLPLTEPLVLVPREFQLLRILNADAEPLAGARVSLSALGTLTPIPTAWAEDFVATTDQYGMCQIPFCSVFRRFLGGIHFCLV